MDCFSFFLYIKYSVSVQFKIGGCLKNIKDMKSVLCTYLQGGYKMNSKIILCANDYDYIDGRNAYKSDIKRLTLGFPMLEENKKMQIALQVWKGSEHRELTLKEELPIHQVIDLMIFLSRSLLHFKEAYRMPLLYNPNNTIIERIGVQGGVMPVSVFTENKNINQDIIDFSQSISDLDEITGERIRVLSRILEEMEY